METETIVILNNRASCPLASLKRLQQEIEFIAPGVPQEALLTTEQLSGKDYWDPLSKWEKTLAGMCMVYLVEHGLVPFENVPRLGRNPYPLLFRRKASYTSNR